MLGTSLSGAQAAFVLTTGQAMAPTAAALGSTTPTDAAIPAADAASGSPAAAAASTDGTAVDPNSDSVAQQHERLRQRLAAAAAAAQARQRVTAAAVQAGNPALEAAAAADSAGLMQPPNVARLRLWNPLTGHVVPVRDPSCELREVRDREMVELERSWCGIRAAVTPQQLHVLAGYMAAGKPIRLQTP